MRRRVTRENLPISSARLVSFPRFFVLFVVGSFEKIPEVDIKLHLPLFLSYFFVKFLVSSLLIFASRNTKNSKFKATFSISVKNLFYLDHYVGILLASRTALKRFDLWTIRLIAHTNNGHSNG